MISAHPEWSSYKEAPIRGNLFEKWWKSRFRFVDYPFLLVYRGFGNSQKCHLQGHVFQGMALNKPKKKASAWQNFIALLKMFLVKTVAKAKVEITVNGKHYHTQTNDQGFFDLEIEGHGLSTGWHQVSYELKETLVDGQERVNVKSETLITEAFEHGLISDIDDTFLVSHVTKKPKKLFTLLTKNANTRKPVEGVVKFYKALSNGHSKSENPFFYVSSSEWNLYEFLVNFNQIHELPKGVLLLKELKDSFLDFFKSGYGSHRHKVDKIERILRLYPNQQFVLLGDNGQHDPQIYLEIAAAHPGQIKAVYIRGVKHNHWNETEGTLSQIKALEISTKQFKHSSEAFDHAKEIGLIGT
ncbi:App1 family protein [Roseivirga pacifica]|uniref:App1 family protein n=1 Tax=Roseivirga pacifica TaxID=1267423 RepID=UPI003BAAC230